MLDLSSLDLREIAGALADRTDCEHLDFADAITDERAGRRLARAIQGKGAFRRFKDEFREGYLARSRNHPLRQP